MIAFVDTNILLHYDFERADWAAILGGVEHRILVCWVNVHELDRLKDSHHNSRRRDRARRVLQLIESVDESGDDHTLAGGATLAFCGLHPTIDFAAHGLDQSHSDHQLVATALEMKVTSPGADIVLVTHDVTPRLAARRVGLSAFDMPAVWKLPASEDPNEREVRRLKEELDRERHRRPRLSVGFGGDVTVAVEWPENPGEFDDKFVDSVIALEAERFPLPSERYRDFDPGLVPGDAAREEGRISRYLLSLRKWLEDLNRYLRETARIQQLIVEIRNDGNAPATNVELQLAFPPGVRVLNKATAKDPPKHPDPPVDLPHDHSRSAPLEFGKYLPYGTWIAGQNVSPVAVGEQPDGTYLAMVRVKRVAQQRVETPDPIWIEFPQRQDIESFGITARLLADELQGEAEQELHVLISRPAAHVQPTAEEFVDLIETLQHRGA